MNLGHIMGLVRPILEFW